MNYLLIPLRLQFKPDHMRHPPGLVDLIASAPMTRDLTGSVEAIVEESEVPARCVARMALSDYLKHFTEHHPSLKLSDFTLVYSCNPIKNGRVWAGGHVTQTLNL